MKQLLPRSSQDFVTAGQAEGEGSHFISTWLCSIAREREMNLQSVSDAVEKHFLIGNH